MRLLFSTVLVGFVAACATGETPMLDEALGPSELGGSGGSGSGAQTAGTFSQSGMTGSSGGASGSFSTGGEISGGTFSTGGFIMGGTFGNGGTGTAGTPAAGGTGGAAGGGSAGAGGKGGAGGSGGKAGGGNGGSAGMPPNGNCGQNPIGPKGDWTATAFIEADDCATPTSDYCGPPARGIDGMTNNRYSTGRARMGDEWFQIDFGETVAVSRVVLTTAGGSTDYTRDYEVRMSDNAGNIDASAVIVSGMGQQGVTTINFPAVKAGRYLRVYQKTAIAGWWSLAEVDVTCQ